MNYRLKQNGLTLVELLVAIAVLSIVTALIIPRLRIVNKERNIREAARVVGSIFSSARDRAVARGRAGVVIERNLNFVSNTMPMTGVINRVYFAGTRMYELRSLPMYIGDSNTDFAFVVQTDDADGNATLRCFIPVPLEHDPTVGRSFFRRGDRIRFGNNQAFNITDVLDVLTVEFDFMGATTTQINNKTIVSDQLDFLPLDIAFDDNTTVGSMAVDPIDTTTPDYLTGAIAPVVNGIPAGGIDGPYPIDVFQFEPNFAIERLRKIETSVIDLPAGYMVDMRYSGPVDSAAGGGLDGDTETHAVFGLSLAAAADETTQDNREVQIQFDSKGAIDQIVVNGDALIAGQSMFLLVNEFDPNLSLGVQDSADAILGNPDNLWVTVGFNGGTNIGYNASTTSGAIDEMIAAARTVSRVRSSAGQ